VKWSACEVSATDREFCIRAVASLKRALPVDGEPDITLSHPDSPVLTDLQNGLLVAYAVDQEERFQYVQYRHLAAAGMTETELERFGIANLAALLGQKGADVRPHQNIFAVFFDGNFEASLILLDNLWSEELAHFVPNGFVAAVPCRDILAFCDAENASGILELRQLIQRVENGDHPISSVLYRRHGSIWTPHAD
jgi:uncharacterized protein YtpQ (UPF0354 family)